MSKGPAQFAWKSRPLHGALGHFLMKEEEEDGEFDYSRTGHLWYTGNFVFNNYHNYIILYGEISYNSICTKINYLKKFRSLY